MIPAYRVTHEDLPELDEKTRKALSPLLSSINNTLSLLVKQFNALPQTGSVASTFTTTDAGAVYFDVDPGRQISDLWVSNIYPTDNTTLDSVWSFSYSVPFGTTYRMLFVGLAPSTTYYCAVKWQ